jgi:hypothetical protein
LPKNNAVVPLVTAVTNVVPQLPAGAMKSHGGAKVRK